jgi:intracellular multiplication protein IcmK
MKKTQISLAVSVLLAALSSSVQAQSLSASAQQAQQAPQQQQAGQPVQIYIGANQAGPSTAPQPAHQAQPAAPVSANGISPLPDLPKTAFEAARDASLVATPTETRDFRRGLDEQKRAIGEPIRPSKPVVRDQVVDLSPGAPPPLVRPTKNYGSVVTFIDETGAVWPIDGADAMSADFTIRWPGGSSDEKTAVQVVPASTYGSGNMIVTLKGLSTPVVVSVEIGYAKETDYRADLRMRGRGPKALPDPAPVPMPAQLPKYMSDILQGIPPSFAHPLKMSGGEGQAYRIDDKLILRTSMIVLSPVPVGRLPSPDGMFVYQLDFTPIVLASKDGVQRQIAIQE